MVWYPSCVATLSRYTKVNERECQIDGQPGRKSPFNTLCQPHAAKDAIPLPRAIAPLFRTMAPHLREQCHSSSANDFVPLPRANDTTPLPVLS